MNETECEATCHQSDSVLLASFYLEGVALPTVGVLGLLGNVAALLVLRWVVTGLKTLQDFLPDSLK